MYALPVGVFLLARQWRAFFRLSIMMGFATVLVALFIGPTLLWTSLTFSAHFMNTVDHVTQLVGELQPTTAYGSHF